MFKRWNRYKKKKKKERFKKRKGKQFSFTYSKFIKKVWLNFCSSHLRHCQRQPRCLMKSFIPCDASSSSLYFRYLILPALGVEDGNDKGVRFPGFNEIRNSGSWKSFIQDFSTFQEFISGLIKCVPIILPLRRRGWGDAATLRGLSLFEKKKELELKNSASVCLAVQEERSFFYPYLLWSEKKKKEINKVMIFGGKEYTINERWVNIIKIFNIK